MYGMLGYNYGVYGLGFGVWGLGFPEFGYVFGGPEKKGFQYLGGPLLGSPWLWEIPLRHFDSRVLWIRGCNVGLREVLV